MLGKQQVLIPMKVIDILKEWNAQESKLTPEYDENVTVALLLAKTYRYIQ